MHKDKYSLLGRYNTTEYIIVPAMFQKWYMHIHFLQKFNAKFEISFLFSSIHKIFIVHSLVDLIHYSSVCFVNESIIFAQKIKYGNNEDREITKGHLKLFIVMARTLFC